MKGCQTLEKTWKGGVWKEIPLEKTKIFLKMEQTFKKN